MVVLGGGAVSYERGTPVAGDGGGQLQLSDASPTRGEAAFHMKRDLTQNLSGDNVYYAACSLLAT